MTLSITLTFLVYMLILGPTSEDGLIGAYFRNHAGSFGVHFVGPLFAIADFLLFVKDSNQKKYTPYMPSFHLFAMSDSYTFLL